MVRLYNPGPERTRPWNGGDAVVPSGISEHPDDIGSVLVRDFAPLGISQLGLHVDTDEAGAPLPIADQVVIANADAFYRNRYGVDQTPGELARGAAPAAEPAAAAAETPEAPAESKPPAEEAPAKTPGAETETPASEPAQATETPETAAS